MITETVLLLLVVVSLLLLLFPPPQEQCILLNISVNMKEFAKSLFSKVIVSALCM